MSGIPFEILVEGSVAILLLLTLGYCTVLNHRLKRLHADREALKQMAADLIHATNLANSAIGGLKEAAVEADATLEARLLEAERFAVELANHVSSGQSIMDRIVKITDAAARSAAFAAPTPAPTPTRPELRGAHSALERLTAHRRLRENAA